jgi:hypothetical protein
MASEEQKVQYEEEDRLFGPLDLRAFTPYELYL